MAQCNPGGLLLCLFLLLAVDGVARTGNDAPIGRGSPRQRKMASRALPLHQERSLPSDLEITGIVSGGYVLRPQYLSRNDLERLPQVSVVVRDDPTLGQPGRPSQVRGVSLQVLAQALGVWHPAALLDARCLDRYRAYFTFAYIAAHRPVLAITIDNLSLSEWARRHHAFDPGPYSIVYRSFVPTFQVLAHQDEPLQPTEIVRLNIATEADFDAIAPRGNFAPGSPEQNGFTIAKQNCLRCHFTQSMGGRKSGRDWGMLSLWAREQPAYFARYVRNPKSIEPHAQMPANLEYDAATLSALTAYFRSFSRTP